MLVVSYLFTNITLDYLTLAYEMLKHLQNDLLQLHTKKLKKIGKEMKMNAIHQNYADTLDAIP